MALYRLNTDLMFPNGDRLIKGSLSTLNDLRERTVATLVSSGAIDEVHGVPLSEITFLSEIADKFPAGTTTTILLELSIHELFELTGVSLEKLHYLRRNLSDIFQDTHMDSFADLWRPLPLDVALEVVERREQTWETHEMVRRNLNGDKSWY